MKTCYKCKKEKQNSDFNKCARNADGLQPLCRQCDNEASRAKYKTNKTYFINYAKAYKKRTLDFLNKVKSQPCADCGKTYHPVCMDFDHRENKEFNISQAKYLSINSITKEIKKCEVVCANCHRLRTFKRKINI